MSSNSLGTDDPTVTPDAADMPCAACGKAGDGLKKCTACKSVKYCNVTCQKRHRKAHKKECKRLEREVKLDAAVAAALNAREECSICTLHLPIDYGETKNQFCCGQRICLACFAEATKQKVDLLCPFCRAPMPKSLEGELVQVQNGVNRNDPNAIHYLALCYLIGDAGLQKDERRALGLMQRAAELGDTPSIIRLSAYHREGLCGLERDEKKMRKYLEKGASLGCAAARFNLGIEERKRNEIYVAMYHYRISASLGNKVALEQVKVGYKEGFVSKDELAKTLRAYQQAHDDTRSELRDHVTEAWEQVEGSH